MTARMDSRERILRRQAKSLGLRVRRRGKAFDLREGGVLVLSGVLATVEGYIAERYVRCNPGPQQRVRPPVAWAPFIDTYIVTLAAAGQPRTTTSLRRAQLTKMARELGRTPSALTGPQLVEWFGRHTEWSSEYRRSTRAAVRGFLLWACKAQHIPVHIADDLPKVRQVAASPRPAPDSAWRAALMAATPRGRGLSHRTITEAIYTLR